MMSKEDTLKQVQAALSAEPRINLHHCPLRMELADDGALTLDGELDDIAARKLALHAAEHSAGVKKVVDRLQVRPSEARGDGEILDSLTQFLERENDFRNCTLRRRDDAHGRRLETIRQADGDDSCGQIEFAVEDGVVILEGKVISLSHRRVAEVLAWWVPGCRLVDNRLAVVPAEEDNDDEITDAVRLVLELDATVHPEQIAVATRAGSVSLEGVVARAEERRWAELDAWYVAGVREVVNRLEVRP